MSNAKKPKTPMERLERIYTLVNDKYFDGAVDASYELKIPRGEAALHPGGHGSSKCQLAGAGVPAAQWDFATRTAYFHPVLFDKDVPRYVLVYLMYHELAHGALPPSPGEDVHHERFMVKEAIAPNRNEASKWLRSHNFPTLSLDGR